VLDESRGVLYTTQYRDRRYGNHKPKEEENQMAKATGNKKATKVVVTTVEAPVSTSVQPVQDAIRDNVLPIAMERLVSLTEQLDEIKALVDDTKVRGIVTQVGARNELLMIMQQVNLVDYVMNGKVAKVVTTPSKTATKIKDVSAVISHLSATAQKKLRAEGIIYEALSEEKTVLRLNDYKKEGE
jgi:hypothetical protein